MMKHKFSGLDFTKHALPGGVTLCHGDGFQTDKLNCMLGFENFEFIFVFRQIKTITSEYDNENSFMLQRAIKVQGTQS